MYCNVFFPLYSGDATFTQFYLYIHIWNENHVFVVFPCVNLFQVLSKKRDEGNGSNHGGPKSPEGSNHKRSPQNSFYTSEDDDFVISSPSLISSTSRRVTPTGTPRSLSKSSSRRSVTPLSRDYGHTRSSSEAGYNPTSPRTPTDPITLAKMASRRNTTPIIFSHSTTTRRKPHPVEKKLECTLEELCNGSIKNVKITREVISEEGYVSRTTFSSPCII